MNRTEFPRVSPESVGIESRAVARLLDRLESGFTEMHGLQIMRHGSICAEGWWSPYSKQMRHNLMSVTKTYTATAIGIAYWEGLLQLTDRVIDLFPEAAPELPSHYLSQLTIRDLLVMGSGMESEPVPTQSWIKDFLSTEIVHAPGTQFRYNSVGSALLGAIITRLTHMHVHEYLTPRLFDPIGIDANRLLWGAMPDGIDACGAGLYATAEDNLRLMRLYANGGVWEGRRILPEDFVQQAISPQIDTAPQAALYPFATDSFFGYGYQIWMCQKQGAYRADGAMGQFCIVDPKLDMIISVLETGRGVDGPQKTMDAIWAFLKEIQSATPLPENPAECGSLRDRLSMLSLQSPVCAPIPQIAEKYHRTFQVKEGLFFLESQTLAAFCGLPLTSGISTFQFSFAQERSLLTFEQDGERHQVTISTDGGRALNQLSTRDSIATLVYLSGYWADAQTFLVKARWIETSFEKDIRFHFQGDSCRITTSDPLDSVGPMGVFHEEPILAISIP